MGMVVWLLFTNVSDQLNAILCIYLQYTSCLCMFLTLNEPCCVCVCNLCMLFEFSFNRQHFDLASIVCMLLKINITDVHFSMFSTGVPRFMKAGCTIASRTMLCGWYCLQHMVVS